MKSWRACFFAATLAPTSAEPASARSGVRAQDQALSKNARFSGKVRIPWLTMLGLLAAAPAMVAATAKHAPAGILASNTPFATEYYILDSGQPGPTVFIGGGAHGDEPAGAAAAEAIRHWPIVRGKLVVVPRANVPALEAGRRNTPGAPKSGGNLNRNYPTIRSATPRGTPASEIWALVLQQQPDWLLDLHEGYDFHQANSNSVGSSVIASAHTQGETAARLMVQAVNDTIPEAQLKFVYRRMGTSGMLARAAANHLHIPAMILETTSKRPLEERVRQHEIMVSCLFRHLGMLAAETADHKAPGTGPPIRVALYHGPGTGGAGPPKLLKRLNCPPQFTITNLSPEEIRGGALTNYDVVIFAGGSAGKQAEAIGEIGLMAVRRFVDQGGGYIGICAGAYLATSGSASTRLNLVDAVTASPKWQRGSGNVELELTDAGLKIVDEPRGRFAVHYENGPIVKPAGRADLQDYEPLAWFRTELAQNGTPVGLMVNSPAVFAAPFGRGRVACVSPHPEQTDGLDHLVPRLVSWVVRVSEAER
jgi:predicted deacylase